MMNLIVQPPASPPTGAPVHSHHKCSKKAYAKLPLRAASHLAVLTCAAISLTQPAYADNRDPALILAYPLSEPSSTSIVCLNGSSLYRSPDFVAAPGTGTAHLLANNKDSKEEFRGDIRSPDKTKRERDNAATHQQAGRIADSNCTDFSGNADPSELVRIVVPNCLLTSSETGFFTFPTFPVTQDRDWDTRKHLSSLRKSKENGRSYDEARLKRTPQTLSPNDPLGPSSHKVAALVVLCETSQSQRSLYVFSFENGHASIIRSLTDKERIDLMLIGPGLVVGWKDTLAPDNAGSYETTFWEMQAGTWGSQRFLDVRDRAIGKRIKAYGVLPEGLTSGAYYMAVKPDTPLRLGPSRQAPWFSRLGDNLLIHLGPSSHNSNSAQASDRYWQPHSQWRRVCIVDGGCGYALSDELVELSPEKSLVHPQKKAY